MSRRALEVLALVVLALGAAVALEPQRGPEIARTRLLAGRPTRITVERPGAPPVVVDPTAGTVNGLPADPAALRDLSGALELLAYRRRVPAADAAARGLAAPRLTVTADDVRVRVGAAVPELGQVWVSTGGGWDYLVDEFAARELDRAPADLRRRAAFTFASPDVTLVELDKGGARVRLRGQPLCVELEGGCAAADRERVRAMLDKLADLSLAELRDAAPTGPPELRVTVGAETLSLHGDCGGGLVAVASAAGAGCIRSDDVRVLLDQPTHPLSWVATRLVTLPPSEIDQLEAPGLDLGRRGGTWTSAAKEIVSAEAVRDAIGELAAQRGVPSPAPARDAPPAGALAIRLRAHELEEVLWLLPDGVTVVRRGEPLTLTIKPSVRAAFHIDPALLGDRRVLAFEPTALERACLGDECVARGRTGESWRLVSPREQAADEDAVAALRDAAATLTARRIAAAAATPAHGFPGRRATFTVAATPSTPAAELVLEIGAGTADGGCYARSAGRPAVYVLSQRACAAFAAHLAKREP